MDDNNLYGKAYGLDERGRHRTTASALDAAFEGLVRQRNDFFDSLADRWATLFPDLPVRPGRYEDGKIVLYVRTAPLAFMVRSRLRLMARKLEELPGAPAKIDLRVEIHAK